MAGVRIAAAPVVALVTALLTGACGGGQSPAKPFGLTMPKLIGMTRQEAERVLRIHGVLDWAAPTRATRSSPLGTVVAQRPAPGVVIGSSDVVITLAGTTSQPDAAISDERHAALRAAVAACSVQAGAMHGPTLTFDDQYESLEVSGTGVGKAQLTTCVLDSLKVPASLRLRILDANASPGIRSGSFGGISVRWSRVGKSHSIDLYFSAN